MRLCISSARSRTYRRANRPKRHCSQNRNARGHAQLHRRRGAHHRHGGQHHLSECGRGEDDRLVREEAAGRPLAEVFHILDGSTASRRGVRRSSPSRKTRRGMVAGVVLIRRDGSEVGIEDSAAPSTTATAKSSARCWFSTTSPLHGNHGKNNSFGPPRLLTDLPNRPLLNERFAQAIALARRHEEGPRCCFWTWTASSTSTTPWDMRSATSCCDRSPNA